MNPSMYTLLCIGMDAFMYTLLCADASIDHIPDWLVNFFNRSYFTHLKMNTILKNAAGEGSRPIGMALKPQIQFAGF